ncbi:PAAR domain-containing protein [Terrabacter sp. MAHUQ-38]|uniref:PAAR domain-containing protein n=1 Tax=unclassified Terrabacter TaxID=2630222 RepID=UPI00165D79CF|nr:PAAR domain-containing protein [Terrabacter sp. MAHUQ-38]MBC9819861.1 PAAR domain-containing protein [Terrabacter sp. MAHUQ-38]
MPGAARVGDTTAHGGTVVGPGVATVLIAGMPAAVVGDMHACVIPSPPPHPPATPFVAGSATVLIQGRPALRAGDACGCGATVVVGSPTVVIT